MTDVHASDLYERLGVFRTASSEEIRRAYLRGVRAHPPEKNPEEFQRIREAFETLSDTESRSSYDAASNPDVKALVEAGEKALAEEDFEGAIAAFKRVLVIQPKAHFARNLLGITFLRAEKHPQALDQFVRLTGEVSENPIFWLHRAQAEEGTGAASPAEKSWRRALDLDPDEASAHSGLAFNLFSQKRVREAEQVLYDAISADGVVNFDDITHFFDLIQLKVLEGDAESVRGLCAQIDTIIEEPWQRERVAYRYASLAMQLARMNAFELAVALAQQSRALLPDDPQIRGLTQAVREGETIADEWSLCSEDDAIRPAFRFYLAVCVQKYLGFGEDDAEAAEVAAQAAEAIQNALPVARAAGGQKVTMAHELEHLERSYPGLYNLIPDGVRDVFRKSRHAIGQLQVECPGCGKLANAPNASSRYQCPNCLSAFDFDASTGHVAKRIASVTAGATLRNYSGCLVWLGIVLLIGMCSA